MAPVWGLVTVTAVIVALSLRTMAVHHLQNTMLAEENACVYADVHFTAARGMLHGILDKVAEERASSGNFNVDSLGGLAGDPLAEEAREKLLRAIEICPQHALAHRLLSLVEWHLGNEAPARQYLADYYRLDRRYPEALMSYELAEQAAPETPGVVIGKTLTLMELDRRNEAVRTVDANRELMEASTAGRLAAGRVLGAAGRLGEAEALLRQGITENPTDAAALLEFYWVLRRQDKWQEGADFLMALGSDGKRTVPEAYHLAASMYRHLENFPRESEALRRALRLFPNNVAIRWELAVSLYRQGRTTEARDELKRAMDYNTPFVMERLAGSELRTLVEP